MRLRGMIWTLFACVAVAALSASSAQAEWAVEGGSLEVEEVEVTKAPGSAPFNIASTILGIPVELTATGVGCVGTCTIDNIVAPNHSAATVKFTGVTVMQPANCKVGNPGGTSGTVTTKALTDRVEMVTVSGSTNTFDKVFPETGSMLAELEFVDPFCVLDQVVVPVEGFVYGEFASTGVAKVVQPITFNAASNSISGLTLGKSSASLFGQADMSLGGPLAGRAFSAN